MHSTATWDLPLEFETAVNVIKNTELRCNVSIREIPAPSKIAPHAFALAADVLPHDQNDSSPLGTGRFILLFDEEEPEAWGGPFRIVCFAQAPLETEIGLDPFISDVAWSWLVDALESRETQYTAASGTATRIMSTGYGELAQHGDGAQIELRASWSPIGHDFDAHVDSWADVLCMLAGVPPVDSTENLSVLSRRRNLRD